MRAFLGTACPACGHPGPYVKIPGSADVNCGSCLAELEVHHVGTGDGPFRQFPNELVETPVHAPSPVIDNSSAESRSWWLLRPPLAKAVTIVARGGRLRSPERTPPLDISLGEIQAIGVERVGSELGDLIVRLRTGHRVVVVPHTHLPLNDARWLAGRLRRLLHHGVRILRDLDA